jgi:tetratricopeptide (TPR) repeat protein
MLWDMPTDTNKLPIVLDLARKAIALRPDVAENWETLARLLLSTGKVEETIAVLTEGISVLETAPRLHLMLAHAYYQVRRFDLMHEVLDRAPAIPINDREMTIFRHELLMKTLTGSEAGQAAAKVLALDPTNKEALTILGRSSRQSGNPEIMVPVCETALSHKPEHTRARYELAVAFAMLGRSADARRLIDLEQFVTVTDLATPEGYEGAGAFEAALVSEIARNPTLEPDPIGKATRRGLQTRGLPYPGDQAIMVILDRIRCAVDVYEANLINGLDHPFVERRPQRARLNAWAVVYSDNGRQVAHIHSDGWLSGVYYVSAPKSSSDKMRRGCLVLGSLEMDETKVDPPWGLLDIRPVPGRLVLFPSYMPHATIPTKSTEARVCISFDVVPVQSTLKGAAEKALEVRSIQTSN